MSRYSEALEEKKLGPLTVKIMPDYDGGAFENPAKDEMENGIRFVTFERRSTLSDLHGFANPEAALEDAESRGDYIFPLFKYEHGNVAYNISGFSCPWDSGQVGYIFISKEAATDADNARAIARSVAKTVAAWCNGDFVGFVVEDEDGETIDSCWGFYGFDSDYAMEQGVESAQYELKRRAADQCLDIGC